MSRLDVPFSENLTSVMSVVKKKFLIDEDLIRHGYELRFSELFEHLLQFTREIQESEEKSHSGYFCEHFRIDHINLFLGSKIKRSSDFEYHLDDFVRDEGIEWMNSLSNIPPLQENTKEYTLREIKSYSEQYLYKHEEWDDIPVNFLLENCPFNITNSSELGELIFELEIFYITMLSRRKDSGTLSKEQVHQKMIDKLRIRASDYFENYMYYDLGYNRLLNLDRGQLYEFIKEQQLFESDEAALILGRAFLKILKSAEIHQSDPQTNWKWKLFQQNPSQK